MKTTATNRKIRVLLTAIKNQALIPNPDFQRRLVWTTKDKLRFLDTVLKGYPFPEIYIAAGSVDSDTGEGTELLVDGQQRITTLYEYFSSSPNLNLGRDMPSYTELSQEQKLSFLEYEVVVRDLGKMADSEIKEVFKRINSTKYSLNDMEIHNARFAGAFKKFIEDIASHNFFDEHRIFSANDIRRMQDMNFVATFVSTIMSNYFNRDDEIENFLSTYNDEFELEDDVRKAIDKVFNFINSMNIDSRSRAWKKADLLTLLVEIYRAIVKDKLNLDSLSVGMKLNSFYTYVDNSREIEKDNPLYSELSEYANAALQGTNNRSNRIKRGEILQKIIRSSIDITKKEKS